MPEGLANPLERACARRRTGACRRRGGSHRQKSGGLAGARRGRDLAREIAVGAKTATAWLKSEAVLTILGRCNEDWILVGSDAVDFEISAVMDQKKRTDAFVLASLAKEKIKTDERIIKRALELENLVLKPWTLRTFHMQKEQQTLCLRSMMMC